MSQSPRTGLSSRALLPSGWQGHAVIALGLFALVATLLVVAPAADAQDAQEFDAQVEDLEARRDRTAERLDAATAELDEIRARIEQLADDLDTARVQRSLLEDEIASLESQVEQAQEEMFALQSRIDAGEQAMADRARSIYMHGQSTPVMELLAGNDVDTAIDRATMVDLLSKQDQVTVEAAEADRATIDAAIQQVHLVQAELVERRQQALDLQDEMEADLAEAGSLQDELESRVGRLDAREAELAAEIEDAEQAAEAARAAAEEAARQRDTGPKASAPTSGGSAPSGGGGRACPMHSIPQLFNDWGWPRGGGSRTHKGNDLYGDYREPVFAMASGVWDVQSYGNNAGNWAILRGDDGLEYWYMHLDAHAVGDGARVGVGQQVAYNGWTGNAVGSVYHIHFEIHPAGGGAIDPYPYLAQVC